MRIGILGGTFDPIHSGHLYLAREVYKRLSLKKVIFIPAYLPPHKNNTRITNAKHRYNMVRMAIAGNSKFKVSDIEIKRKGKSYSVETVEGMRRHYGRGTEIFFITGSDFLKGMGKWKDLKKVLRLCEFVVVKRPRFKVKNVPRKFILLDIGALDISATSIRNRIKRRQSINKMVPKKVMEYIRANNLYTRDRKHDRA